MTKFQEIEQLASSIPHLCGPVQGKFLWDLVQLTPKDSTIIEVGVFYGYITTIMGAACQESGRKVFAIDHNLPGNQFGFRKIA